MTDCSCGRTVEVYMAKRRAARGLCSACYQAELRDASRWCVLAIAALAVVALASAAIGAIV